jgi:hypothetical protein
VSKLTKQLDDTGRRIRVSVASLVVGDPVQQLIANRIINSQLTGTQAPTPARPARARACSTRAT